MSIDNLKLRTKALMPLGVMAAALLAMTAFSATRLRGFSEEARAVIEQRDVATVKIVRASRRVQLIPYSVAALIIVDSDTEMGQNAKKNFEMGAKDALLLTQEAADALPDHAAEIMAIREQIRALVVQAQPVFEMALTAVGLEHGRSLKPEELDTLAQLADRVKPFDAKAQELSAQIKGFNDRLVAENAAVAQRLRAQARNALVTLVLLGALSGAAGIAFSFWLTAAKIVSPMKGLSDRMRRLAGGDLSAPIEGSARRDEIGDMAKAVEVFKINAVERRSAEARAAEARAAAEAEREQAAQERARVADTQTTAMKALREGLKRLADGNLTIRLEAGFAAEFADVRDDFNAAAAKLKSALSAVATSTGAIHSSTREISSASDNLSQRTEQQAASLEETAAALEEITMTLKNSAQGAQHAAEVVATADADAKKGAVVVRQAVEAMDAIAASSNKIGQIIGVIDEIAFQTNLLALNAGVEAARAGDSGRGFAVVASEVRALAQRSAEAAKEIKALVSASGAQVGTGVKLVAESGKALESIIGQVSEINKVVAEIASGAQQQATGLSQINVAINQMDQSTQQNATMVEESTAASHSLSQEMNELNRLMEQFHVSEGSEDRLRRDLQAAAPHAFAKPAAKPSGGKPARRPATGRPAPKIAAVSATSRSDWTEF